MFHVSRKNLPQLLRSIADAFERGDILTRFAEMRAEMEVSSANPFVFDVSYLPSKEEMIERSKMVFEIKFECIENNFSKEIKSIVLEEKRRV